MTVSPDALTPEARDEIRTRWVRGQTPRPERSHDSDPLRVACDKCPWKLEGDALAVLFQQRHHRRLHGFHGDRYVVPKADAEHSKRANSDAARREVVRILRGEGPTLAAALAERLDVARQALGPMLRHLDEVESVRLRGAHNPTAWRIVGDDRLLPGEPKE